MNIQLVIQTIVNCGIVKTKTVKKEILFFHTIRNIKSNKIAKMKKHKIISDKVSHLELYFLT